MKNKEDYLEIEESEWVYYSDYVPQSRFGIRKKNEELIEREDRNGLILNNRPLVYYCSDRFGLLEDEDAIQEGMVGLIKEVDRFLIKYHDIDLDTVSIKTRVKYLGIDLYNSITNYIYAYFRKTQKLTKNGIEFVSKNPELLEDPNHHEYIKDIFKITIKISNYHRSVWDYEELLRVMLENDFNIRDVLYYYTYNYPNYNIRREEITNNYRYLINVCRKALSLYRGKIRSVRSKSMSSGLEQKDYFRLGKLLSSYQYL